MAFGADRIVAHSVSAAVACPVFLMAKTAHCLLLLAKHCDPLIILRRRVLVLKMSTKPLWHCVLILDNLDEEELDVMVASRQLRY